MTFTVTPTQFSQLKQKLADSHQADMVAGVDATAGTISHDGVKATYNYVPNTLTVLVTVGGNFVVNHVIHSKVQSAIDALK